MPRSERRHPIASVSDLKRAVDKHAKGTPLLTLVRRDGSSLYAAIPLS